MAGKRTGRDRIGLTLTWAAVAIAAGAQAVIQATPWPSLAGFLTAMLLFALGERRAAEPLRTGEPPPPRAVGAGFWMLLAAGTALCFLAAAAVYARVRPGPPLLLWVLGLSLFVVAGIAGRARRRPGAKRFPRQSILASLLLVAVTGLLLGWRLTSIPPEVHGDDAQIGLDALNLLRVQPLNLFATGWFGLPRLHALPTLVGIEIFGPNLLGLRSTSVALGIGTVLLLFALVRRLWGFEIALLAALVLSSQRFFLHLGRTGHLYIDTPFVSVLALWLFVRLWQERSAGAAVACGLALGIGVQNYFASRLVPVLVGATWLLWWLRAERDRKQRLVLFGIVALVAFAAAAPMAAHFLQDTRGFWGRTRETSVFSEAARLHLAHGYGTDDLWRILLIQLRAALTLFHLTGDTSLQYGYRGPLLEPLSAVLFVLGVGRVLARPGRPANQLAFLWTAVPLVAGAALTIDTPFYPRISGILPFTALLIALAMEPLLATLRAALPGRRGNLAAGGVAAALLAVIFAGNVHSYFLDYAPKHRLTPFVEISAWVRENGAGKTTYLVGGLPRFSVLHGTMSFLTRGYRMRDLANPETDLRPGAFNPAETLFVIVPGGEQSLPALIAAAGPLDVQTHHDEQGAIRFFTAVPHAAGPPAAPAPTPRSPRAASGRSASRAIVLAGAAAAGVLAAALALGSLVWSLRRPRRVRPPSVLPSRWRRLRSAVHSCLARVFGPDDRERRAAPPRLLTAFLFAAIVLLALFLRVVELDRLPDGFYCDEAGLGYNAYSILRTGTDETGAFLPLYVWSFGVSYKNPVFIYASMIPLALLGPSDFAVRLTAALFGTGTVAAIFFLGRALGGAWLGLLAALFLAVCPWHLHFSRIAFELVAFPFFFVLGFTSLVRYTQGRRTLPLAAVLLGYCLYTYAPAKLFVPLFLAGFACLFYGPLLERWRESLLAAFLFGLTIMPVVVFDLEHQHQATSYFEATSLLGRNLPPADMARTFTENYRAFFSQEFLFERGDRIPRHAVREHGELYRFFAPFLLIGAVAALGRRERAMRLSLWWLALYPIAPALMNEIPSASRGFIGASAFCLLAAIGAHALLRLPAQLTRRRPVVLGLQLAALAAGITFLAPQVHAYWNLYSGHYRRYSAKYYSGFQFGKRQVVQYFLDHYDDYDTFILSPMLSNQPEIFLRFYAGLRRPPEPGIPRFRAPGKMHVNWPEDLYLYEGHRRRLFAVQPAELLLFEDYEVRDTVIAPDGSPAYLLVDVRAPKDFVYAWRVAGPYSPKGGGPAPDFDPDHAPPFGPDERRWTTIDSPYARVRVHQLYGFAEEPRCAWAVNFAYIGLEQDIKVFAGFDDSGEVWVNGERVELRRNPGARPETRVDAEVGNARLHAGRNTIAVRTCDVRDEWVFYFRIAGLDGGNLDGVEWEYHNRFFQPARPVPRERTAANPIDIALEPR
jgi:4-amino-4-deoxy-L-arabinose transferase-like glycosyltransferase